MGSNRQVNLLFAAVRIVACWCVVSVHFGHKFPCFDLAVPVFMVMAFYFFNPMCDRSTLYGRLWRIALPMCAWGTIGFLARCVVNGYIDVAMLFEQLLFGMPANSPLYFLNLVLVNTVCVWLIFRIPAKYVYAVCVCSIVSCLALQYTGLNRVVWKWLPLVGEITCGRFAELFPAALIGALMRRSRTHERMWQRVSAGLALVGVYSLVAVFNLDPHAHGYGYAGCGLLIGATGICLMASIGDSMQWKNHFMVTALIYLSGLTAGIYYAHKIVGEMLRLVFVNNSIGLAVMTFILSAVLVVVASKIRCTRVFVK